MQPDKIEDAVLDARMDEICAGLVEAIDREVETLRREGFPIYVSDNGQIIDLQQTGNLP
jgi:hypothetical protein